MTAEQAKRVDPQTGVAWVQRDVDANRESGFPGVDRALRKTPVGQKRLKRSSYAHSRFSPCYHVHGVDGDSGNEWKGQNVDDVEERAAAHRAEFEASD
jgi:hypothetical protein